MFIFLGSMSFNLLQLSLTNDKETIAAKKEDQGSSSLNKRNTSEQTHYIHYSCALLGTSCGCPAGPVSGKQDAKPMFLSSNNGQTRNLKSQSIYSDRSLTVTQV